MDKERFTYLFNKQVTSELSPQELQEFIQILQQAEDLEDTVLEQLVDGDLPPNDDIKLSEDRKLALFDRFRTTVASRSKSVSILGRVKRPKIYSYIAVAAAILLFCLIGVWKQPFLSSRNTHVAKIEVRDEQDILLPNDSLPTLHLSDGSVHILDASLAAAFDEVGVKIEMDVHDGISYRIQQGHKQDGNIERMVLSAPKGHTVRLILDDQTAVLLNSGSSLEYPSRFAGSERKVRLQGEAYFQVTHSASNPFFVETDRATVKVLGTTFNVKSYKDEKSMTTTLIDGSVELISGGHTVRMKPGEQANIDAPNALINKYNVDIEDYVSWTEGYFSFNNLTLNEVLESVSRWYDIEDIVYGNHAQTRIYGTFKRTKSLKELLRQLEKISGTRLSIKERRIMVL